ncbi:MAG: SpoIVB peptidase S55 domain-containing protein [Candidatus Scalindua sp.]
MTNIKKVLFFCCAVLLFSSHLVLAWETMDTDEIKPGMKGYGRTVFSGMQIESFDVEILGVLKNWEARNDMILIKMTGGPLEKTGIIAGMSGSPVYIDNKLIGAVSHGWSYSKDAIAGVTPIRAMMDVLKIDSQNRDAALAGNNTWSTSLHTQDSNVVAKLKSYGLLHEDGLYENTNPQQPFILDLVPIQTPLMVSGFDYKSLTRISPLFGKIGRFSLHSSSGESSASADLRDFMPGSAVAVEIIRGDLSVSAIGTVTYRDGNDILAFGHPIIQIGNTDLPMATAEVHTILASQAISTKMASPGKIIGRITQDRRSAIAGKIGEYTQMIPCLTEIQGSLNVTYNFEVVHDRILTPLLIQMAVENALLATEKTVGDKSMALKLDIGIAGRKEPIRIENEYFDSGSSWFPIYNVIEPISMLLNNEFQTVKIESIKLIANISEQNNIAFIDNIRVSNKWVSPGDEIHIDIRLRPYTREYTSIPVKIKIPDDVAPGSSIKIIVCDAMNSKMLEMTNAPGRFSPSSFEQLIRHLEDGERNNNIIVKIRLNKRGLTYMGEDFPSLPNSFLSIMSLSNQSGVTPLRSEMVKRIPTKWIINGKQTINLFVNNES